MKNKLVLSLAVLSLFSISAHAASLQRKNEKKLYVGSNSTEAKLTYDGLVEYESSEKPTLATLKDPNHLPLPPIPLKVLSHLLSK